MAQKSSDPQYIVDGISALDAGMNSGVVPQSLAPNQTAFSTNATHRGGFIRPRPPFRKINLDFAGSKALQELVTKNYFQGSCFYKPDSGDSAIVAAIAGRLFQFVPDTVGGAKVTDITIPGDPNPPTTLQAWLWQSERFVIWQDGNSLPVFYDGVFSRRSLGNSSTTVASIIANFTIPALNATVQTTIAQPYNNAVGIDVTVNGDKYQVVSFSQSSNTSYLLKLTVTGGSNIFTLPDIYPLKSPSGFFAYINSSNPSGFFVPASQSPPYTFSVVTSKPYGGSVGDHLNVQTNAGFISCTVQSISGTTLGLKFDSLIGGSIIISGGGFIQATNITWTNVISGDGNPPTAGYYHVFTQYTGAIGAYLYSQNGATEFHVDDFKVDNTNTFFLTLKNINGTPGNVIVAPVDVIYTNFELPTGRMGAYGLGRNWVSLADGRSFIASDIVGGSSGTIAYNFRDAVLKVTENTYLAGGGTFVIPGSIGDIQAMIFTANLDQSLGQGPLQVATASTVFSCQAPVDRTTWASVTNPILTESLKGRGAIGQYGTILVNSDTMFRSIDGLSSLIIARRDFDVWGNVPISFEVDKVFNADDPSLLTSSTAIQFDNRVLYGTFPKKGPFGVYHEGIVALNLDPVSSLRGKAPSIYDGLWTGINVIQFVAGTFGNTFRAFAFVHNTFTFALELWELLPDADQNLFDDGNIPISWSFETGSKFINIKGKGQFDPIKLEGGEIYLSNIRGIVNVQAWYKPDFSQCWIPWIDFDVCADNMTDLALPTQQRTRLGLGAPSIDDCDPTTEVPYRIARNFQFRFQITGACTFMGGLFKASLVPEVEMARPVCDPLCDTVPGTTENCEPCRDQGPCLQFPFVFYNLSNGKSYTNPLLGFDITCPDGVPRTVYVQPGTINYTLPFPIGFAGPYPPLVMGCSAGGLVVREVPNNATQEEIDVIVLDMINTCALAIAAASVDCTPVTFKNETVFFDVACPPGTVLHFDDSPPV